MKKSKRLLSAYTVARYCSDIADVVAGINEIMDEKDKRNRANKKIPDYFYIRLSKLNKKHDLLTSKNKTG